jgi:HSP20 family protein
MSQPEVVPVHKTESIINDLWIAENSIRQRAFEIFCQNDFSTSALENWLHAAEEITICPKLELREDDRQFTLNVALPGVDPQSIDIEVTALDILVKAEMHHEHRSDESVHQCEFKSGKVVRAVRLPKKINPDKVKAEIHNGMLQLTAEICEEMRGAKVPIFPE